MTLDSFDRTADPVIEARSLRFLYEQVRNDLRNLLTLLTASSSSERTGFGLAPSDDLLRASAYLAGSFEAFRELTAQRGCIELPVLPDIRHLEGTVREALDEASRVSSALCRDRVGQR